MTRKCYEAIEHYMLTTMDDSAHDAEHVYRVLYNALEIAKSEASVDMDILIAACLLHDIGRPDQVANPSLCHAEVGSEKLTEAGFSTMLTDVLIIEIAHEVGSLQTLLKGLSDQDVNIEYMYGLSIEGEKAYVVLKTQELEKAIEVIKEKGLGTLTTEGVKNLK